MKSNNVNTDILLSCPEWNSLKGLNYRGYASFIGKVANSISFVFEIGNGSIQTTDLFEITHKYRTSGTNSSMSIFNDITGKTISVATSVIQKVPWLVLFNNADHPEFTKWGYDIESTSNDWSNAELQYQNRPEYDSIINGIITKRETDENFSWCASASLRNLIRGMSSCKNDKVEVRAKLPLVPGTWPAFRIPGHNISAAGLPACDEIDNMEYYISDHKKAVATLHQPSHSGGNPESGNIVSPMPSSEFRKYSVEWIPEFIHLFGDDFIIYIINIQ